MACLPRVLLSLAVAAVVADAVSVVSAGDAAFVTPIGRSFPVGAGLGFSWLGGGLRVSHTGTVLRAICSTAYGAKAFKVAFYATSQGNFPFEGVAWVPATGANESVVVASGAGKVAVMINTPADYWASPSGAAVVLALETDGEFLPADPAPAHVLHVLGDSITAATNIHGGYEKCADGGQYADYASSWAGILCSFFDASCSTVAVGGKGCVRGVAVAAPR